MARGTSCRNSMITFQQEHSTIFRWQNLRERSIFNSNSAGMKTITSSCVSSSLSISQKSCRRALIIQEIRPLIPDGNTFSVSCNHRTQCTGGSPICKSYSKDMVFGCGRQTCCDCGIALIYCPIRQSTITKRIKLNP